MYEVKPNQSWKVPAIFFVSAIVMGLLHLVFVGEAAQAAEPCTRIVTLAAAGYHQSSGAAVGEVTCYRLEAPGPGFLVVALAASDSSVMPPRIRLLGPAPHGDGAAKDQEVVFGRSATHLTLWLREGTGASTVAVTANKRDQALGAYHLTSRFLAEDRLLAFVESGARPPVAQKGQPTPRDSEEGEIDPILLNTLSSRGPGSSGLGALQPGIYTVLVEDRYSLVFGSLSW